MIKSGLGSLLVHRKPRYLHYVILSKLQTTTSLTQLQPNKVPTQHERPFPSPLRSIEW